ncbi:HNH endonuclease [Anaeromyxobacter terrae]|uniref:HNH endonuclease n=1 Tax=Anaeromyxobacter terrae TaxID=2925406 RepID=UPI001F593FD2|nr:HNH endonuclease [Anaeromyxobacter sp. SG22]
MLRVLVGENTAKNALQRAARRGKPIGWIVPKDAQPGNDAVFLFNRSQFTATGVIEDEPTRGLFGNRPAFRSLVGELKLLQRPLELEDVRRSIPEWAWLRYPRSYATPPAEIASRLNALLREADRCSPTRGRNVRARKLTRPTLDAIVDEQVGDLQLAPEGRKVLRTHVATERNAANRQRLLQVRAAVGALRCDACGIDVGARYGDSHAEVLEVHHRIPLSKGPQVPKGTDAFALLCATCHRVVHHGREIPMAIEELRRILQKGRRGAAT